MNSVGIHTPSATASLLAMVNRECTMKFTDSSWINDESDSIYNEENDIIIYVPSKGFNYYLIKIDNDQQIETKNIDSVISVIQNFKK